MDVHTGGRHCSPFLWAASQQGESFLPGDQLVGEQAQSPRASQSTTSSVCVISANAKR